MNRNFNLGLLFFTIIFSCSKFSAQIIINEGSNKNYAIVADEDAENKDWIELYNAGTTAVDLFNYALSDNEEEPNKWTLPHYTLEAGSFLLIHCSGKNRFQSEPSVPVLNETAFTPQNGWNEHGFNGNFTWDGVSNLCLNVCSYSNVGYTVNSEFRLYDTGYASSLSAFIDGSDASCQFTGGGISNLRPVVKINGIQLGDGDLQNSPYDYPAPYGNWYWSARNQFIFRAEELIAAGLQPGPINTLAFDVISANPVEYTYVDFQLNHALFDSYDGIFLNSNGNQFHTNFKLDSDGETVYLFSPSGALIHQLDVDVSALDLSVGSLPNGSTATGIFQNPTPGASNNGEVWYSDFALPPVFSVNSGIFPSVVNVSLFNANPNPSEIRYTTDGSNPTPNSPIYNGTPLFIYQNTVLKARCFKAGLLPSEIKSASYLIGVSHTTPIVSVTTASENLYGPTGIFDNFNSDWEKSAHIQYFDETPGHPLLFSQATGMRMDGGAGGSRSHPQHSFRLDFDHSLLGANPVYQTLIPDRPNRSKYSRIYLRNGSNQWMIMPHKDAAQVRMMGKTPTHNYYMEWRPVSVYINGNYFGLYELREKFDKEYFEQYDGASENLDLLSLSYFYGGVLRAVEGSIESFWDSRETWSSFETSASNYMEQTNAIFDLENYSDYIIAQVWMGNTDWPQNNIKLYRKDSLSAWKFCIQDLELAMNPNGWSDCQSNTLERLTNDSENNPYTNMWLRSLENTPYKRYFLNRFADLMNSTYLPDSLHAVADDRFNRSVAEMPKEFARWGDPNNISGQMNELFARHQQFKEELACRNDAMREDILAQYSISGLRQVELDVAPAASGKINISTLTPVNYPWNGIYFAEIPVKMEAIADSGFVFSHWDANPLIANVQNPSFTASLSATNTTFKANFIPDATAGMAQIFDTGLNVFPNPASNLCTVAWSEPTTEKCFLHITAMDGRLMKTSEINKGTRVHTLDCSGLDAGIYLIRCSGKTNWAAQRLVVQR